MSPDDELDLPSEAEQAYAMYEALTDALDEAVLRDQESEGQPVGDVWADRSRELADARSVLRQPRDGR